MATPDSVTRLHRDPLPSMVEIDPTAPMPPHSPRETSMLKQQTGFGFQELVGADADDGDRERVLVWFKLRRMGYEPTWEEAGDVLITYAAPDPTTSGGSPSSPASAGTGG